MACGTVLENCSLSPLGFKTRVFLKGSSDGLIHAEGEKCSEEGDGCILSPALLMGKSKEKQSVGNDLCVWGLVSVLKVPQWWEHCPNHQGGTISPDEKKGMFLGNHHLQPQRLWPGPPGRFWMTLEIGMKCDSARGKEVSALTYRAISLLLQDKWLSFRRNAFVRKNKMPF